MKKLILSITAVIALATSAMAQAPDFGFETWANISITSVQDPVGWASLNALSAVTATPLSVSKETTAPYAGAITCKITTVQVTVASIPNPFRPGKNFDTAGIVGVGKIAIAASISMKFGNSISGRPAVLSFASKYTPMAGDSGFVAAYLTHYNTSLSKRDTIARGEYATGATTASYSVNSITMSYDPAYSTVLADTMLVFGSSSIYRHAGAKVGSVFYLDGLAWSGYNSINELNNKGSVSVYPNPAVNNVTFSSTEDANSVQIMDLTGRVVGNYNMTGNKLTIGTTGFAPGIYIYNVVSEKQVINRGKFEVSK